MPTGSGRTQRGRRGYVKAAYAAGSVVVLSAIHLWGVRQGKWTQNVLTVAKVAGLAAIVLVGVACTRGAGWQGANGAADWQSAPQAGVTSASFSLVNFSGAMIFVLFAFGGWNERAYVARR